MEIPDTRIDLFQQSLLEWWEVNRRDLPWRHTRDPYRILVSEVMLQQTQVDRVIPYYHAWLEQFPTVQSLAAAPVAEVIRLWKGLGYNRRAVNLQRTAQAVVDRGGEFPRSVDELRQLPGIGPYTAGAIACFAFEQPVSFTDVNMKRVLHRVFVGPELPKSQLSEREFSELAARVLPDDDSWTWNQALIEFGALQCSARKPRCVVCTMQSFCQASGEIQGMLAQNTRAPGTSPEVFRQSNRYFRGRVVDALRVHEVISLRELGPQVRDDFAENQAEWLYTVVSGLERDGLLRIAEEAPGYDVLDRTVSLP